MGKNCCCVPLCTTRTTNAPPGTSWHGFPQDEALRRQWIRNIRRDPGPNFHITKNTKLCSTHFLQSDFRPFLRLKVKCLKSNAVPKVFEWTNREKLIAAAERTERYQQRCRKIQRGTAKPKTCIDPVPNEGAESGHEKEAAELQAKILQLENDNDQLILDNGELMKELATATTQVESLRKTAQDIHEKVTKLEQEKREEREKKQRQRAEMQRNKLMFKNIRHDNNAVQLNTGFKNAVFFIHFLKLLETRLNTVHERGNETVPVPKHIARGHKKPGLPSIVSNREKLFFVLLRLKQAYAQREISQIFGISVSRTSAILKTWISLLYDALRDMFPIPPPDVIKQMTPSCSKNCPDTTLLLDCIEFKYDKPFTLHGRRYKCSKFLVAMTPSSLICFVSRLYVGNITDKQVVLDSGFLNGLLPGHSVMTDNRFDIDTADIPEGVTWNIFPDSSENGQEDAAGNTASDRDLLDQTMKYIRTYKILNQLPIVGDMAHQVVSVCSMLTNLKSSFINRKTL